MNRFVSIIQIGDIHYPDTSSESTNIELHDHSFPVFLSGGLVGSKMQASLRSVAKEAGARKVHAVCFMGDLTDRGDVDGFGECLKKMHDVFIDDLLALPSPPECLIIPGNHDLVRMNSDVDDPGLRFREINTLLLERGHHPILVDEPRLVSVSDSMKISIHGINTCFGCGTKRNMHPIVADHICMALDNLLSSGDISPNERKSMLNDMYDLDTPAIHQRAIEKMSADIEKLDEQCLVVICGHHNIIPQQIPRISPYTELVNSGMFRSQILGLKRPAIYLHGHIHDDPIEVIKSADQNGGMLALISAPLFSDGYNIIRIEFDEEGVPLGAIVEKFRTTKAGVCASTGVVSIPFWRDSLSSFGALDMEAKQILGAIQGGGSAYYSDIAGSVGICEEKIVDKLGKLQWLGYIRIDNYSLKPSRWIIRSHQ